MEAQKQVAMWHARSFVLFAATMMEFMVFTHAHTYYSLCVYQLGQGLGPRWLWQVCTRKEHVFDREPRLLPSAGRPKVMGYSGRRGAQRGLNRRRRDNAPPVPSCAVPLRRTVLACAGARRRIRPPGAPNSAVTAPRPAPRLRHGRCRRSEAGAREPPVRTPAHANGEGCGHAPFVRAAAAFTLQPYTATAPSENPPAASIISITSSSFSSRSCLVT